MYHLVGIILGAIMVISTVLLTWRWFSVIHGYVDPYIVLCSFFLMVSLSLLILSILFTMRRMVEEIENAKRVVSISCREIEDRIERKIAEGFKDVEESLDKVRKIIYR